MPSGAGCLGGAVWGRCCPADGLRVFKRLKWLFFEVGSISAKKARILKNVILYNFFTFFYGLISCQFPSIAIRRWAGEGLQGLYIAPFFADFRWLPDLGELSSVFSACYPSSVAVLLVLVGADSVKLWEGRLYICMYYFRYSEHSKVFFK